MCWKTKKLPEKKVATEDISIIKVVAKNEDSDVIVPYYMLGTYKYKLGEEYKTRIGLIGEHITYREEMPVYFIEKGFHSYSKDMCSYSKDKDAFGKEYIAITKPNLECAMFGTRIHNELDKTSINKFGLFKEYEPVVVSGYVPKGSEYYLNEEGEIVSDKIVLKEVMDI